MRPIFLTCTLLLVMAFSAGCHRTAYSEFSQVDRNGNSVISEEEYLENWYKENYFQVWDENSDGQVNRAEWNIALKQYYPRLTYSASLYQKWQMDRKETLREKEIAQGLFRSLDQNGDGKLSPSEYRFYR